MDSKLRVKLIRKGNELFNNGNIEGAIKIFEKTGYRDGLTRVADYYFYDLQQPLVALKYYRLVNRRDKVNEIFERMMFALNRMLGRKPPEVKLPPQGVTEAENTG